MEQQGYRKSSSSKCPTPPSSSTEYIGVAWCHITKQACVQHTIRSDAAVLVRHSGTALVIVVL
eukprot:10765-Heterococcus_DN1.PRE.2